MTRKKLRKLDYKDQSMTVRLERIVKNKMVLIAKEKDITISDLLRWLIIKHIDAVTTIEIDQMIDDVHSFLTKN